tara:strand:- start:1522 stop:1899 length:378 start_codon:yes stop_codon:yes gene_type:complete
MQKISSNKSFGLVFFIFFLLLALWPLFSGESLRIWALLTSLIFLILGLINSNLLSPFNFIWVKFGDFLGRIISPIIMGLVYFIIITPIGLFMRLIGKDILNLKFNKSITYWIKRKKNINSMKRQF